MLSFFKDVLQKNSKEARAPKSAKASAAPAKEKSKGKNNSHIIVTDSPRLSGTQSEIAFYKFLFNSKNNTELTVPQKLVLEMVKENLRKKENRSQAIPRLPMVIPKLLRSLRDPDSSVKDYVEIVKKDPVMSAAVLKLANSVYFNPIGARIDDIERAVVKLGISGLRSVLSAAVMQPIIQKDSPYYSQTGQRLWQHSLNCAVSCELIGEQRGIEKFKVYLLGLVHDIGKITIFSEVCKQLKLNGDEDPSFKAFAPLMKKSAATLSYEIAKDWQLPDEICIGLKDQIDVKAGNKVSEFGLMLYHANICCEAQAFTPLDKRDQLSFLLEDFKLPKFLFAKLDEVSTQV